ncbi:MAG: HlyD family efflux transporter periplasmic adaptor subunit [Novosphingobium meiothermophilum]
MSLFRPEVMESRRLQRFGRTVPLYSSHSLPITLVLLFGAIVVSVWMMTGSYARTQLAEGWVVPNGPMASVVALQPGMVASIAVREGDTVKAGQPVARLSLQTANAASADPARQSLEMLARQGDDVVRQGELARASTREEQQRLRAATQAMNTRMQAIERQIAIQREQVKSAEASFAIMTRAEREKAINRIDFEGQRRALLAEKAQLQQLVSEKAALSAQIAEANAELRLLPIRLEQRLADLRGNAIDVEKQRMAVQQGSSAVLTAPFDGIVGVVQAKPGQTLNAQQPVMQILGANTVLEAELYAPTRAIGFARVGQDVRLMYDAFPYEQYGTFTGTITEISRSVIAADEVTAPVKPEAPSYRIRVRLGEQAVRAFGQSYPVQPGMTLKANIILERQSFLDWLLEPVNAIRNRLK